METGFKQLNVDQGAVLYYELYSRWGKKEMVLWYCIHGNEEHIVRIAND